MIGQAAWVWAKMGIMESDDAGAYSYISDDESAVHEDDYHDSEEKLPPVEPKDERSRDFDHNVLINRTRPEVCDQEVNLN